MSTALEGEILQEKCPIDDGALLLKFIDDKWEVNCMNPDCPFNMVADGWEPRQIVIDGLHNQMEIYEQGGQATRTPMREPGAHEDNEDIALVNAVFLADKLLVHLADMDLAVTDPRVLSDALAALSQLAIAQASVRQAEAATRQAAALEKIAAALWTSDGDLNALDGLYAIAQTLARH